MTRVDFGLFLTASSIPEMEKQADKYGEWLVSQNAVFEWKTTKMVLLYSTGQSDWDLKTGVIIHDPAVAMLFKLTFGL